MKTLDQVENRVIRQARVAMPVFAQAAESKQLDNATRDWAQQMHALLNEIETKGSTAERAARLMMLYLMCSEEM